MICIDYLLFMFEIIHKFIEIGDGMILTNKKLIPN